MIPAASSRRFLPLIYGAVTIGFVLLVWTTYALLPVLTLFMIAALIAYLLYPLQHRLLRYGVHRNLAAMALVVMTLLLGLVFLVILVPMLFKQLGTLYHMLTTLFEHAQTRLLSHLSADPNFSFDWSDHVLAWAQTHADQLQGALPDILRGLSSGGMAVIQWTAMACLIPIICFYCLRDADAFLQQVMGLFPRRYLPLISSLRKEMNTVLSGFMRGELMVILTMSLLYTAGLWAVGLDTALPIGIISGLLTFIPYVGAAIGLLLSTLSAFVQMGTLLGIVKTLLVFLIGQALEANFITPKLVGKNIGLHPLAIIFTLLAFGELFGFLGLMLALPVAAMMYVCVKRVCAYWKHSDCYQYLQPTQPTQPATPPTSEK